MTKAKHSPLVMVVLLVMGLLIGSIIGEILAGLGVPYIFESKEVRWNPAGDFVILAWNIDVLVKINLASVMGLVLVFYIYRKL